MNSAHTFSQYPKSSHTKLTFPQSMLDKADPCLKYIEKNNLKYGGELGILKKRALFVGRQISFFQDFQNQLLYIFT